MLLVNLPTCAGLPERRVAGQALRLCVAGDGHGARAGAGEAVIERERRATLAVVLAGQLVGC